MSSWIGDDDADDAWDNIPEQNDSGGSQEEEYNGVNRFWLPKGEERKVVMLSEKPTSITEHRISIDGNWFNYFTCLRVMNQECPLCEHEDQIKGSRYEAAAFSAIDVDGFDDNQNLKTLIVAKAATAHEFRQVRKVRDEFRGVEFLAARNNEQKSPSVGNSWTPTSQYSEEELREKFGEEKIQEYDYAEIFDPLSQDKLEQVVKHEADRDGSSTTSGSGSSNSGKVKAGSQSEEDLDFDGVEL